MTVWTEVDLDEVNVWLKAREIGPADALDPVEDGVEDSVYCLTLQDGRKCCLRLFERTEPHGPMSLASCLAEEGLPSCPPIIDRKGQTLVPLKGKPAALFPWIDGAWIERPSLIQIEVIGSFLGRMGQSDLVRTKKWDRPNPRDWEWFRMSAQAVLPFLGEAERALLEEEVALHLSFWQDEAQADLPVGPVHADLFRNNVMFLEDGSLGAVIDWGFCASGCPLVYDLAIVANDWCLGEDSHELDPLRLQALLRGYEGQRCLTAQEKDVWPMALRWAALRFYLSRLYDFHLPRQSGGRAHCPQHFRSVLEARRA